MTKIISVVVRCHVVNCDTAHFLFHNRHNTHLGSMVPWFHGSTLFLGKWNHGTMEPRFQATHFGFHGSMVPPKNSMSRIKNFVGWNHGTMEPRFQATQKRFHGSMVPPKFFLGGTMEPWNLGSRLHKKGSMVPRFRGGTMEP